MGIVNLSHVPVFWLAVFGFAVGAIFGSFLSTLVVRWPVAESVVSGCSRCDGCGRALHAYELIPVLGFLLVRGRCGQCKTAIDPIHPIFEVIIGCLCAISLLIYPNLTGVCGALLGLFLITLVALDIRHFWLPDRLTLPLIVLGLLWAALPGSPKLMDALIGAIAGYGGLWLINWFYRLLRGRDGLGGGDAKLLGAIGAWLGWQLLPIILFLASGLGIVTIAIRMIGGRSVAATDRLPLGALLAVVTWPLWLVQDIVRQYFSL